MAGKTEKDWEAAKAQALKILGKQAKLPKPRVDPVAAMDSADGVFAELFKVRDTLESKIAAAEDACSLVIDACKLYGDMIDSSDFGLDAKKPDDKKLIDQVQQLLGRQLAKVEAFGTNITKILANTHKALASLEKEINATQ